MNTFLTNQLEDVKNDLIALKDLSRSDCVKDFNCHEYWDYYVLRELIKTKLQKYHEWASEIQSKLKNKEKHGVFILDAKVVDDEMIKRALNQTHEQEIELLKEDYEIKIKSARIDERNKVCQELINEFELSTFISEVEKLAKENGVELK